jgi:hypothetical protein
MPAKKKRPKGRSRITHAQLSMALDVYAGIFYAGSMGDMAKGLGISKTIISRLLNTRTDAFITNYLAEQFSRVLDYCRVKPQEVYRFGYTIAGHEFEAEIIFNTVLGRNSMRYFVDGKRVKNVAVWEAKLEKAKGMTSLYSDHGFHKDEGVMIIADTFDDCVVADEDKDDATGLNFEGIGELPLAEVLERMAAEHSGEPTEADMDELTRAIIDRGQES